MAYGGIDEWAHRARQEGRKTRRRRNENHKCATDDHSRDLPNGEISSEEFDILKGGINDR